MVDVYFPGSARYGAMSSHDSFDLFASLWFLRQPWFCQAWAPSDLSCQQCWCFHCPTQVRWEIACSSQDCHGRNYTCSLWWRLWSILIGRWCAVLMCTRGSEFVRTRNSAWRPCKSIDIFYCCMINDIVAAYWFHFSCDPSHSDWELSVELGCCGQRWHHFHKL